MNYKETPQNRSESRTRRLIKPVLDMLDNSYEVHINVKLSSIIPPENLPRLSNKEYEYCIKADFDFVIYEAAKELTALFAIEYDGPIHGEPHKQNNDQMKNHFCKEAAFPLIRLSYWDIKANLSV
jgi:hypothetical protein